MNKRRQEIVNYTLAIFAGGVGCLTLIIVLAAVLIGLWLDSQMGTRPKATIALVLVSIPVSLATMFLVARWAISRIRTKVDETGAGGNEEAK